MDGSPDDDRSDDEWDDPASLQADDGWDDRDADDRSADEWDDRDADEWDDPASLHDDDEGDNVFGPRPDAGGPILPGEPELENVAFVLLGVATSLLLVADLIGLL